MYDFKKFLDAQKDSYERALAEIKAGHKRSHWIWFIFPQLRALGRSRNAFYYGIKDLDEAKEYLEDEILRARLLEISQALLELATNDPVAVMGHIDSVKLRSCMTLFHLADPTCEIFKKVLDKYFSGQLDELTVELCKAEHD